MPKECVHCAVSDEQSYTGTEFVMVEQGADIVVVLEQKSCMAERSQQVIDLMKKVESELRRAGLVENQFGVVGFGGAGINEGPHVETMNGELFDSAANLALGLRDLHFDGQETGDALGAVSF
ncbi:hypothetical protein, partial [Salmonella sp. s51884]|uniref:hypothetical protein n=1 Tax=Salmonella sp. s51884 TaxID=3159654 RepID=UPI00397F11A2